MNTTCRAIACALLLLTASRTAQAVPEYIQTEQTSRGSVTESVESTEHAFTPRPRLRIFPRLHDAFVRGSMDVQLRNYYFQRNHDTDPNREAWAQGGEISYRTSSWKNRLDMGATLFTSQKLYGPSDKDGTNLLKPGQKSYTVLGEAYIEARLFGDLTVKAYRQRFNLPYLNGFDTRMTPNTFEAVTLGDSGGKRFVYVLSQTWGIKKQNATNFVSMTEAAGIDGPDRAMSSAGMRYTFDNGANIGLINHYTKDFINIFYSEANSRIRPWRDVGLQFSAQYTRQHAIGDQLGGNFDARVWGAKVAASRGGLILSLAHTSTANNADIRSDWGGDPSYISIIVENFNRAGEDAWLVGLSSDFRHFGDSGFSAFINYARGDTPDRGRVASPDQSEFDLTLDYKPKHGQLKGLWFRLRGAFVNRDDNSDFRDIRLIANYDFSPL